MTIRVKKLSVTRGRRTVSGEQNMLARDGTDMEQGDSGTAKPDIDVGVSFMQDHVKALAQVLSKAADLLPFSPKVRKLIGGLIVLGVPIAGATPMLASSWSAPSAFQLPWNGWRGNEFVVIAKEVDPAKLNVPSGCNESVVVDLLNQAIYSTETMTFKIVKSTDSTHAIAEVTSDQVQGTTQVQLSTNGGVLRMDFGGDTSMFLNMEDDHGIATGWMSYHDCAIGKKHLQTPVAAVSMGRIKDLNERKPLEGKTARALSTDYAVHN